MNSHSIIVIKTHEVGAVKDSDPNRKDWSFFLEVSKFIRQACVPTRDYRRQEQPRSTQSIHPHPRASRKGQVHARPHVRVELSNASEIIHATAHTIHSFGMNQGKHEACR